MPIPLIVWGALAAGGALGMAGGGYQFGRQLGQNVGRWVPVGVGCVAVYVAYQGVRRG